ncbi:MAG: metallophosphoesterase [bacterium]
MTMTLCRAALRTAAFCAAVAFGAPLAAQQGPTGSTYSFVVLGHLRGGKDGPNPKLPEVLDKVRGLKPAFVVLTGDAINGDAEHNPAVAATVLKEWSYLDSALATLGVPVYRVPGNHEIQDLTTRDIYWQRYGKLPQVKTFGKTRLLLLSAVYTPADGDTSKMRDLRGVDLDSTQVKWLKTELGKPGFEHTFAFMHHLLWWEADTSAFWREVHPLFVKGKVDALFSGDYGPLKFSTMTKDSVRYFQTSIEGSPSLSMLQKRLKSRLLSSQFDNFLEVKVNGPKVDVAVHTVAEVSSGFFTPEHYNAVDVAVQPKELTQREKIWAVFGSTKRLIGLALVILLLIGTGWVARGMKR